MSRHADLYILDEPIAGVDPAARDFIFKYHPVELRTGGFILISTHLIADIENILDESHLHRSRSDPAHRIRG